MTPYTEEPNPDPKIALASLKVQFDMWRKVRKNRRDSIPDIMRKRAIALIKTHRKSHIIKACGINSNMLKCWQKELIAADEAATFIPLPVAAPVTAKDREAETPDSMPTLRIV